MSQNQPNLSDPNFWESMGITPIIFDPSSDESIADGLEQITEQIKEFETPSEDLKGDRPTTK